MSKEELGLAYETAELDYKEALATKDEGKIRAAKKRYQIAIFDLLSYRADRIYEEYYSSFSLGSTTK